MKEEVPEIQEWEQTEFSFQKYTMLLWKECHEKWL